MNETKIRNEYRKLTNLLIDNSLTITTMESATSGQVASLITDCEGSSAALSEAYVTYSNEAKIKQGVPQEVIETYGVYSKETAIAMAKTCREKADTDIGIGVTGSLGNVDPNNNDSVPGVVYYCINLEGEEFVTTLTLPLGEDRHTYKMMVAEDIVAKLLNLVNVL